MFHYLLYIIIQKGIPAMGCLGAVLEMRGNVSHEVKGREEVLGQTAWGSAIGRELCSQCHPLIAVVFYRAEWDMMASRQKQN